jgi:hypothetical protein
MATATILIVFNPQKLPHTTWIFLQNFMKFDERNPIFFSNPHVLFPWQLRQFVQPIPIVWDYLVPPVVNVFPTEFHKFLFVHTMFHQI